jgi:hypothetical protein
MSFSFSAKGKTRAELTANIKTEIDKIVASQPIHGIDAPHVVYAANAFAELIPEPGDGLQYNASVNGSVSSPGPDQPLSSVSFGVSINYTTVDIPQAAPQAAAADQAQEQGDEAKDGGESGAGQAD